MQRLGKTGKRLIAAAALAATAILAVLALRPSPLAVDLALVERGPLEVLVEEDGQTRIREKYVVSTPFAGRLLRVALEAGDSVEAGTTVLAEVEPQDPQLLDSRARAQAEAMVKAAEAAWERAGAALDRARSEDRFAANEHGRVRKLYEKDIITGHEMERVETLAAAAAADLRAAQLGMQIAEFELEQAKAALLHTRGAEQGGEEIWRFAIRAPIDGRVLRVLQESTTVLPAGAPLLELGDPADLEVIVDVLSSEAVRILPGAKARFEHWGGQEPLQGRVRLVEPAAFTKISALGVEEQRVWVVMDFTESPERLQSLGDGYRVEARVVVWEGEDVLQAPAGALFRAEDSWAVFVVENGRAHLRRIERGQVGSFRCQVLNGLEEGERVVLHPGESVRDGVRVEERGVE
ncbi:MAG TPA: HlyD family efflux transporter periplasmic adaptor subunit [Verrucomicrobiales bacterium]|nr:HlyD family efflux transporter periplasmic adaptor subunit [Verrucomicrobiales bacterium]